MGKADMAMSEYLGNRKRFADLFNGILFQGKQVIREEELSEASPSYRFREQGEGSGKGKREGKLSGRSRDVKMRLKSGEVLRVLAVENQNQVDYTMPLRCMEYDALEYRKQLSEHKERNRRGNYRGMTGAERLCGMRKEEKLFPVYTICLYHGEKEWDGPRKLSEMMDFGKEGEAFEGMFSDYPMRLYCIGEEEDFDRFHTELRELFCAVKNRRDKRALQELMEKEEGYRHLSAETAKTMSVLLNMPRIWEERERYMEEEEEEEYDMCQAIKEWIEDERKAGYEEGIKEGIKEGIREGIEEGRKEGIKEGMKAGKAKGETEMRCKIACNLKKTGLPLDVIIQTTGLTAKEIDEL